MTDGLHTAEFRHRTPPPEMQEASYDRDGQALQMAVYRKPGPRLNYTCIFTVAVCAFMLITWLYGNGCFDRFINR